MDRRRSRPFGLFALALLPIAAVAAVDPASWHPFGPLRWMMLSTLAVVAIGGALVDMVMPNAPTVTIAVRAWALLLAWMALCATLGTDPLAAWIGTSERHFGWITWALCAGLFVAGQRFGHRALPLLARSMTIGAGLLGAWSLAELLDVAPVESMGDRLTGPFGSAAMTGAAVCLMVPMSMALALDRTGPRWRRFAAAVAAVGGVVALVGSGARAAWLGAAVASTWVAVTLWRNGLLRPTSTIAWSHHRRTTIVTLIAAATGAVLALGAVGMSTGIDSRVSGMFDRHEPGGISRIDDWSVGVSTLMDRPIVGAGPEGYRTEAASHVSAAYERRHGRVVMIDRAHSGPLDVALISGIPGLVLYGALVVIIARAIWRRYPSLERPVRHFPAPPLEQSTALVLAATASLIAYGAQQLLLFPLSELDPIAWALAGALAAHVVQPARSVEFPHTSGSPTTRPVMATTTAVVAVTVLATTVLATAVMAVGLLGVAADHRAQSSLDGLEDLQIARAQQRAADAASLRPDVIVLQLLESRTWGAGSSDAELRHAVIAAERASRLAPRDPAVAAEVARARSRLAAATRQPADVTRAETQWQFALTLDPRNASLLADRGRFAAEFGDAATANRYLTLAADLAPRDPTPLVDMARLALAAGRPDDAISLAKAAQARSSEDPAVRALLADLAAPTSGGGSR